MFKTILAAPLAAIALAAVPAAAAAPRQPDASIPFINHGGIYDWRATSDDTIYFEDNFHHWYKATLMSPSPDLPFAWHIGVQNSGSDRLDRWATVVIDHQPYQIQSFVRVPGPPPTHKHKVD